ncbi:carboxypeptidase-like regulatory domain-containing protein, partial [Prevotella multiformis]|uniref:carboxypeptidase-like regulatory domain-containing protein n=1 Tax=Prevotella multiformis TaxID=282402 RepID=UPI0028DC9199
MKHIFMMLLFLVFSKGAYSQMSVKGNIVDENDKEVIGCSVRILSADSTFLLGGVTNDVGEFHIKGIESKNFIVHLSYIGYEDQYITC